MTARWWLLRFSLPIVISVGLLAVVLLRLELGDVVAAISGAALPFVVMACLAQLACALVTTMRWRQILAACGVERRFGELFALVLIGLFLNTFLPTATVGDLARGYYAARRSPLLASYSVVLVEKVLALVSLAIVAGAAATVLLVVETPLPRGFLAAILILSLGLTVIGCGFFLSRGWRAALHSPRLLAGRLGSLADAADLFRRGAAPRTAIAASSIALQLIWILFHLACAWAVPLEIPTLVLFLAVPISVLASRMPISLNGLGVREGVLVAILDLYGAPRAQAGAFVVLALLVSTAFSLLGGAIYPFYRARYTRAQDLERAATTLDGSPQADRGSPRL